jgi:hypothetical protein
MILNGSREAFPAITSTALKTQTTLWYPSSTARATSHLRWRRVEAIDAAAVARVL